MAIDLPPPVEPLPFAEAQIRAYGDAVAVQTHEFGSARIHIAGGPALAQASIVTALAAATTPSDVVRGLALAYYRAGYPAVQVYYARLGQDLHLLVLPGRVEAVVGPAGLRRYFEALKDEPVLRAADLEPARALASVHAARSGRHLQLRLAPGSAPGRFHLMLEEDAGQPAAHPRLRLQLGNPGNRFVGRDFAETEVSLGGGGGELRVLRRQSLDGEHVYREHAGSSGLVSPSGMYAIEARRVDYAQRQASAPLEGRVSSLAVSWSGLPYADFQTRWVAGLRLSSVRDSLSTSTSTALIEQSYTSAQLSLVRAHRGEAAAWPLEWQVGTILDFGLDGRFVDAFGGDIPDSRFLILRPSIGLQLSPAPAPWTLGADAQAQFAHDSLPRQQQFVLGGDQALAAWLPGVIVADRGYLLRLHASRSFAASAWTLRPRLFAEIGGGRLDGSDAGTTNADALADAGLELGVEYGRRLSARVVAAVPLIEPRELQPGLDALRAELFFQVALSL